MKRFLTIVTAILMASVALEAKVALPSIFSDNMVLQQQRSQKFWGTAKPKKRVSIVTSWDNAVYETRSDADGKWAVCITTPKAGGPYTITVSDGDKLILENILIGEVWLCTGQSNMEMSVEGVKNAAAEIKAASDYPQLRLLHVKNTTSPVPLNEVSIVGDTWKVCSAETIAKFSAAGYFFGRDLYQNLEVPIGLIETCWGGTLAEAWTSEEALKQMPYFDNALEKLKVLPLSAQARNDMFVSDIKAWAENMKKIDPATASFPSWIDPDYSDASWRKVELPGYVQQKGFPEFVGGIMWMRRTVDIPAEWAGKELVLDLGVVDDHDYTFFNGVELGHTEGCFAHRRYTVPAALVKEGKAVIAVRVFDTGGLGGIVGNMRIGLDKDNTLPISGTWTYNVSMDIEDIPSMPVNTATEPNFPTFLYNAMLHPLKDYNVQGAIWYQGEANVNRAAQYADLLPLMINDWRTAWGYNMSFYIAQLANYMEEQKAPEESVWAELRDAQRKTLHLENTGMAILIDIGEARDIHPKNKQDVGHRLALLARAKTYGQEIVYAGPEYRSYRIVGNTIRIQFNHAHKGLKTSDGSALKGFTIAGADHTFYWADAVIEGDEVVVSAKEVAFPLAVRYAWANNPLCNLINGEGLPAGPFRTDNWLKK